jgi:hypothetical protein
MAWKLNLLLFLCVKMCFIVKRYLMSVPCNVCLLSG